MDGTFDFIEYIKNGEINVSILKLLIEKNVHLGHSSELLIIATAKRLHILIEALLQDPLVNVTEQFQYNPDRKIFPDYERLDLHEGCLITLLFIAAQLGDKSSVKKFLKKGADINFKTTNGWSPLLASIAYGHVETCEALINWGASINDSEHQLRPPLHVAAEFGHTKLVKFLLRNGAKIDAVTAEYRREGQTALHVAADNGHLSVVKVLLQWKSHTNFIDEVDQRGDNAVNLAIAKGHDEIVKILLDHCATLDWDLEEEGLTNLFTPVIKGHENTVKVLIEHGVNFRRFWKTEKNRTPLTEAVDSGKCEMVRLLLEHGSDVDVIDPLTMNEYGAPLVNAARKGYLDIVDMLIKFGAPVNGPYPKGETPLFASISNGHADVAELLLANDAKFSTEKQANEAALCCAEKGYFHVLKSLLSRHVNNYKRPDGQTALHIAAKSDNNDIVKLCLQKGFNKNAVDKNKMTALTLAAEKGLTQIVKTLLKHGANLELEDNSRKTPIYYACQNGDDSVFNLLIDYGANINRKARNGKSPLVIASQRGEFEIVKTLVKKGAIVNTSDNDGHTALHYAAKLGELDTIKLLLEYKANVELAAANGKTPLIISSERGSIDCVSTLVQFYTYVHSTDSRGFSALNYAAELRTNEILDLLLKHGASNISRSENSALLILQCAEKGYYKFFDTTMKSGARFVLATRLDLTNRLVETLPKWRKKFFTQVLEYFSADEKIVPITTVRCLFDVVNRIEEEIAELPDEQYSNYKILVKILAEYFIKLKVANLYDDENLVAVCYNNQQRLSTFRDKCKTELIRMKSETLDATNIFVSNILENSLNANAILARNDNFSLILRSGDFRMRFPLYCNFVRNQFDKGKIRRTLMDECVEANRGRRKRDASLACFAPLPANVLLYILKYLHNRDLRSMKSVLESEILEDNV